MIYQLDHVSKDYRTREGSVHALADFSLSLRGRAVEGRGEVRW
jgi:hypothetical protein